MQLQDYKRSSKSADIEWVLGPSGYLEPKNETPRFLSASFLIHSLFVVSFFWFASQELNDLGSSSGTVEFELIGDAAPAEISSELAEGESEATQNTEASVTDSSQPLSELADAPQLENKPEIIAAPIPKPVSTPVQISPPQVKETLKTSALSSVVMEKQASPEELASELENDLVSNTFDSSEVLNAQKVIEQETHDFLKEQDEALEKAAEQNKILAAQANQRQEELKKSREQALLKAQEEEKALAIAAAKEKEQQKREQAAALARQQESTAKAAALLAQQQEANRQAAAAEAQKIAAAQAKARQAPVSGNGENEMATTRGGSGSGSGDASGVRSLGDLKQMPGNPTPRYGHEERLKKIEGEVVFHAYVTADGKLTDFKILKSSGSRSLDGKTLSALKKWKFFPNQSGWVKIPFVWSLKGEAESADGLLKTMDRTGGNWDGAVYDNSIDEPVGDGSLREAL